MQSGHDVKDGVQIVGVGMHQTQGVDVHGGALQGSEQAVLHVEHSVRLNGPHVKPGTWFSGVEV